jgi:peroxiredoxin (alkyl hydroperoxide reductase subunit C)
MSDTLTGTMPRIGDKAPDFTAVTTHGEIKFSDWKKGSWTVLFSHPADFTPVCTTEFIGFATRAKDFEARNVKLIGLSIDSIHAHLAWVQNIREKGKQEIPFPVIADLDMKVANLYGMIHSVSSTATVRAVFIIDDKDVIRLILYYPMNVGRNIDEVLRAIDGLQTADKNGVACPANWKPGDRVIVPPPKTQKDLDKRLSEKYDEVVDFYLVKKSL